MKGHQAVPLIEVTRRIDARVYGPIKTQAEGQIEVWISDGVYGQVWEWISMQVDDLVYGQVMEQLRF